ncbi:MAG: hypothetical protein HYU28_05205 [Actinobacteria bacterium]|nr:hypothetical protein [Actinomycetota bacterium]
MLQRTSPHWRSGHHGDRPRVLVEDPHGALRDADFSAFLNAGFEVALCTGPDSESECPLVASGECGLVDAADVVLFGLGTTDERTRSILRSLRQRFPETPVVVEVPRTGNPAGGPAEAELPDNCVALAFPASVEGQMRALWDAVIAARRRRARPQRRRGRPGEVA